LANGTDWFQFIDGRFETLFHEGGWFALPESPVETVDLVLEVLDPQHSKVVKQPKFLACPRKSRELN
jgi:hypothetical protein